jgi:ribosomal protein S18 acetylase RimI-like enzyme
VAAQALIFAVMHCPWQVQQPILMMNARHESAGIGADASEPLGTGFRFLGMPVSAMAVISAPSWKDRNNQGRDGRFVVPKHLNQQAQQQQLRPSQESTVPLSLRIRSTTRDDLPTIAGMLAKALVMEDDDGTHQQRQQQERISSFKQRMEVLQMRAGVLALLQSRWDAVQVGRTVASTPVRVVNGHSSGPTVKLWDELSGIDQLHVLWSHAPFRQKLEKAARLSNENHVWKRHNFACEPTCLDWLCHQMMTAENTINGEVVGFCEIAMLPTPSTTENEISDMVIGSTASRQETSDDSINIQKPVPTIANLITSPQYRRRGIGSRLITSAARFVRDGQRMTRRNQKLPISDTNVVDTNDGVNTNNISSPMSELALFVEHNNQKAIKMYESLGFMKKQRVQIGRNEGGIESGQRETGGAEHSQWYMSKHLSSPRPSSRDFSDMDLAYI